MNSGLIFLSVKILSAFQYANRKVMVWFGPVCIDPAIPDFGSIYGGVYYRELTLDPSIRLLIHHLLGVIDFP